MTLVLGLIIAWILAGLPTVLVFDRLCQRFLRWVGDEVYELTCVPSWSSLLNQRANAPADWVTSLVAAILAVTIFACMYVAYMVAGVLIIIAIFR